MIQSPAQLARRWSQHGSADRFLAANLSIGLGHFLVLFNGGAYLPMIPKVAGSLGCNPGYGDWTQDLYFLGLGLAFPLAPWLRSRLGDRGGLLLAFALFAVASALNALSTQYGWFLFARILAALAGGLTIPLSLSLLLSHYHAEGKSRGLFLWGWASITPFAFGPFLGGLLADTWGWRWLFILDVPLTLLVFLGIWFWEEPDQDHPAFAMDWLGYAFLAITLSSAVMFLNFWDIDGWWDSTRNELLLLLCLLAALALLLWSWPHRHSIIDLRLLRRRNFALAALGILLSGLFFQGTLAVLVVLYQLQFGFSAYRIGVLLLPMALLAPVSAAFSHWYLRRHDPRWLGVVAMLLLSVSAFWMASWALPVSPDMLCWPPLLVGLGLGALFGVWARIGLWGLAATEELRAASLLNLLRSSGQALGIPITAVFWARRSILHRHFLIQDPQQQHLAWNAALQRFSPLLTPAGAQAQLADLLGQQAAMLAFNEVFTVAGWGFLALAALSLFVGHPIASAEPMSEQMAIAEMVEP
ncbi:MFS transporter [Acidithiobacillus sp. IBUN Pt1247-S3]|uniref:MFS transporter n=1 Tax=Acidithiobacillus sp. IBUN Pt1247-S3 TaxID=3166642 RepID=UPI0034E51666